MRVGGVEVPNNKRVEFSLQYIHGIGRTRARQILVDLQMENKITKDLSEEELITLREEVSKYMIEGDLVSFLALIYPLCLCLFSCECKVGLCIGRFSSVLKFLGSTYGFLICRLDILNHCRTKWISV